MLHRLKALLIFRAILRNEQGNIIHKEVRKCWSLSLEELQSGMLKL